MKTFSLKIMTPEKIFYSGECVALRVPLEDGEYGIMANHENVIGAIAPGVVKITTPSSDEDIIGACDEGILKVHDNTVYLLVDAIEYPEDIDEAKEREEMIKAEEILKYNQQRRDRFIVEAELRRAVTRLKVKKKYRK
ncbi:MAG: ATP synthase F1 subunit epsilon [Clostridia bacterium]|nr:ATP synthase F1 subunit epsilon [Clostridia bacterium]